MVNSVTNIDQGFPQIQAPLVNEDRTINRIWLMLFTALWNRTGMGEGVSSADAIDFALMTENRLAIPIPNVDTDASVESVLSLQPSGAAGSSGFEGDLVVAAPQHQDDLASALFFPVPPASGASASTLVTKDEGTVLTSATASLNFVGANIAATAAGNDVTITDNGMLPLCNGDLPGPGIMADGSGQCIGVVL